MMMDVIPLEVLEVQRNGYVISTDPARLDLDMIHGELNRSYWAAGRLREVVARSLQHSLCLDSTIGRRRSGWPVS
jgi:hypothetical protein